MTIPTDRPIPDTAVLLTKRQVAALLQTSERTVERWAADGVIPGRLRPGGGNVRFARRLVEQWLADGCPMPEAGKRRGA